MILLMPPRNVALSDPFTDLAKIARLPESALYPFVPFNSKPS